MEGADVKLLLAGLKRKTLQRLSLLQCARRTI